MAFRRPVRRRRGKQAQRLALVAKIIEALDKLGGAAHRDLVVDQIAVDDGLEHPTDVAMLRKQVHEVFLDHCEERAPEVDLPPTFRRVFGPESLRWSFTPAFQERLRNGAFDPEQLTG